MGEKLFGDVTEATGLPQDLIAQELSELLTTAGVDRMDLTLDDLRAILSEYVQDVLLAVKEEQNRNDSGK